MFENVVLIVVAFSCVIYESMEDFSVDKFALVKLPKLKPDPIEQNLAFQVENEIYHFVLMPQYAIISPYTNISFVSMEFDQQGEVKDILTEKLNSSDYSDCKFEGSSVTNHSVVIRGFVNKQGDFEGYFIQNGDIYVLDPYIKFQSHSIIHSDESNSVLYKMSDICHHNSKLNRTFNPEINTTASSKNSEKNNSYRLCEKDMVLHRKKDAVLDAEIVGEMSQLNQNLFRRSSTPNVTYLCNLKIILDHRFYKFVGKNDKNHSVNIVVSLLTKVDRKFRCVDFNEDGVSDNIGFYIDELIIYRDPVRNGLNQTSSWDAIKFFQEFREYDFSEACAGLLFTFREMQSTEENGPSLIKTQLTSEAQGICSPLRVTVPKASMHDYGEYIANALPVNFRLNGYPASDSHMMVQIMHQLGHLFGAPNDDFYSDDDVCCKKMRGRTYAMAWPVPPGDHEDHRCYSSCSIMAMSNYLSKSSRPCLRTCEGFQCDRPLLGIRPIPRFVSKNVTIMPPMPPGPTAIRDWTEYCFTVPRSGAHRNTNTQRILIPILVAIVFLNFY